jgi:hypothetical protein
VRGKGTKLGEGKKVRLSGQDANTSEGERAFRDYYANPGSGRLRSGIVRGAEKGKNKPILNILLKRLVQSQSGANGRSRKNISLVFSHPNNNLEYFLTKNYQYACSV